nr:retrovirus-related Pol polyprotein from transposon TNT 1-94 [Tanacetum cinerariifolium]
MVEGVETTIAPATAKEKAQKRVTKLEKVQLTLHSWLTLLQVLTLRLDDSEDEVELKPKIEMETVKPSFAKIKFVKSKEQVKSPRKTTIKRVVNAVLGNKVNALKASACWVWKPKTKGNRQIDLQNKRVIDIRCSRNMPWNMSYLIDYKEIDGGYVAFKGNPKGRKIIGRDGFVRSNTYKNLNKKMHCLVFIDDYSRFTWVFFLASKDETSSILKIFITGIEKLVDHKVKVIRCDNRTEFKNREMNQFCKMKVKFDGKADEGFFVRYSLNSKAFRVFNNKTKIVEENLHVSDSGKKVDEDSSKGSECKDQEQDDNVNSTNNVNAAGTNRVNVVGTNTNNKLLFDPVIPALEDISTFNFSSDHEDDVEETDMTNMDTTIQVSPAPTTRIHKDHPLDQVIGDLHSTTQIRHMSKNLEEHGIEAIRLFLAYASFKDFVVYQMDVKSAFLYGMIEEEVYICQPLGFEDPKFPDKVYKVENHYMDYIKLLKHEVKNASTPIETQKPLLKDEDEEEVDVYMYRSMIGSLMYLTSSRPDIMFVVCSCARYQVNPKVSHLYDVKKIFRPTECEGFEQIVDFLNANPIKKPRRKVTEVPQPSDPISVADEAVNKEMNDSLERAVTTAASLDAKQDIGNIFKTQSKATPNEHGSQGTSAGGGLRCQEAMGDTVAQTRVLNLETTKTTQALEINSLKRRVKKLKRRKRSRTHGLKILYKVGLSARVESSEDESLSEEDASKQGRIVDIDSNEDIILVSTHDDQMFDVDQDLGGEEVFVAQQDEKIVEIEKEVDAAQIQVTTAATTPTISIDEVTVAQAFTELKHTKTKSNAKGIVFHEPEESTTTTTIPKPRSQDKGKAKMIEEPVKLKKDQIQLDEEVTLKLQEKLQAEFEKEQRLKSERAQQEGLQAEEQQELNDEEKAKLFMQLLEKRRKFFIANRVEEKRNKPPTQAQQRKIMCTYLKNMEGNKLTDLKNKSYDSIQKMFDRAFKRKIDDDKDTAELQPLVKIIPDEEGVAIDAIPLAVKPPSIVD